MVSLVKAYSNEYQEIIDAELAYDLYWAGLISKAGSNYYTVHSIVSKYIRYRQEQSLNEH